MENILFDFIGKYMTLTEEEKEAIVAYDIFNVFPKNATLLKEGQYSDESYFVLSGCIRCYYMVDGEEKTTAFYTESEVFSPVCVTNKNASEYNVACVEDSIIAVSTTDMEQDSFDKYPRLQELCRLVAEDLLAKKQDEYDIFKITNPEQRYLKLLETRPELFQRVPQYQMASYLGITPQSLSRMRKRLVTKS